MGVLPDVYEDREAEMSKQTENQKLKQKLFEELQDKKRDVENMQGSLLCKYGWEFKCDFPDCCWRWCKSIKGVTLAVSQSDAIHMEESTIEYGDED